MNLYKYQTVSTRSLEALFKHSLYFAKSDQLNDPTENMFQLLDADYVDRYRPDISGLGEFGILAMAKGESTDVEASPFMWAHYGNQLKGFFLVFDFDSFVQGIQSRLFLHDEVDYNKYRKVLSGADNLINESWGIEQVAGVDNTSRNTKRICKFCFFQKPKEFVNEREYRFLSETSGLKHYHIESLSKVIIGKRMDPSDKAVLLSTLESLGLSDKVEYATTKNNSFKVHITKRDPQ
ncbi:DUF2971 domain-containing protein [Marinomonas sp. RSW2]|uniref:DUF2971 domain-containing protein n=1 Tax=Marinomonas maritima TaxID=2940935 RepID=A0ABT5WHJ1_9GAMM|nr:DUF2971 domain-containing protein [Marinomonas maritima]MDE8604282.1 DUF2971 domain-containing protein [Marinomonas maritima]